MAFHREIGKDEGFNVLFLLRVERGRKKGRIRNESEDYYYYYCYDEERSEKRRRKLKKGKRN